MYVNHIDMYYPFCLWKHLGSSAAIPGFQKELKVVKEQTWASPVVDVSTFQFLRWVICFLSFACGCFSWWFAQNGIRGFRELRHCPSGFVSKSSPNPMVYQSSKFVSNLRWQWIKGIIHFETNQSSCWHAKLLGPFTVVMMKEQLNDSEATVIEFFVNMLTWDNDKISVSIQWGPFGLYNDGGWWITK